MFKAQCMKSVKAYYTDLKAYCMDWAEYSSVFSVLYNLVEGSGYGRCSVARFEKLPGILDKEKRWLLPYVISWSLSWTGTCVNNGYYCMSSVVVISGCSHMSSDGCYHREAPVSSV
eukprot:1158473-Pelagomonas_calceolata.AAC.2